MRKIHPTPTCETCGEKFTRNSGRAQKNRFCSLKCRGLSQRGENHFRWLGGNSHPTTTQEYKVWRLNILIRDRATCRWCRSEGLISRDRLEVHHIIPRAARPDLALVDDNAITLCRSHHLIVREKEKDYAELFASLLGAELLDVPSNARRGKFNISQDELRDLYCNRQMSMPDIADLCGVTTSCISYQMKLAGIASRTISEANAAVAKQKLIRRPQKIFISDTELVKMYWTDGLSLKKMASILGVHDSSVHSLLKRLQIPVRGFKEAWAVRRANQERAWPTVI